MGGLWIQREHVASSQPHRARALLRAYIESETKRDTERNTEREMERKTETETRGRNIGLHRKDIFTG